MKKLLLFLAFISFVSFAIAQTSVYHPFPASNAVWCETRSTFDGTCYHTDTYIQFINGDTIIGSYTYHKLYKTGSYISSICGPSFTYHNQLSVLLRQDIANKKVYMYDPYVGKKDTLLYYFNLSLHDTLSPSYTNICGPTHVSFIDSILIDSTYRKRFGIGNSQDSLFVGLIEGVGSDFGLLGWLCPPFEDASSLNGFVDNIYYPASVCGFHIEGIKETTLPSIILVYPNPAIDKINIESSQKSTIEILNIQGQLLKSIAANEGKTFIDVSAFTSGVYIIEVKTEKGIAVKKFIKE